MKRGVVRIWDAPEGYIHFQAVSDTGKLLVDATIPIERSDESVARAHARYRESFDEEPNHFLCGDAS